MDTTLKQIFKHRNIYGNNPIGEISRDYCKDKDCIDFIENKVLSYGLGMGDKPTSISLNVTNDTENEEWSNRSKDYWDMNYYSADKKTFNEVVLGNSKAICKEIMELSHSNTNIHTYAYLGKRDNIYYGMFRIEIRLLNESDRLLRKYTILFKYNEFNNINKK